MTDTRDIIKSSELGDGFIIFQNDAGYWIGIQTKEGVLDLQGIDSDAYNALEKMEGSKNE